MQQKTRQTHLLEAADLSIRLSWYEPGRAMAEHSHQLSQVSVLLAGGLREIVDSRQADNPSAYIGYKPSGLTHANLYGEVGALILSLNFPDSVSPLARAWGWQAANRQEFALVRQILSSGSNAEDRRQYAQDLMVAIASQAATDPLPPRWSRDLRDRFHAGERVDLNSAGEDYGLHPAHISRGFRQWFGAPPSLYALRCRMSRAVNALLAGDPAAVAAHDAGFTDQSHLIRTLKRETGLTPTSLKRHLAA